MRKDIRYLVKDRRVSSALYRNDSGQMSPLFSEDGEVLRKAGMLTGDGTVTQYTLNNAGSHGFASLTYDEMMATDVRDFAWPYWLLEAKHAAFVYNDNTLIGCAAQLRAWCSPENTELAQDIITSLKSKGNWLSLDAFLRSDGRVKPQVSISTTTHYQLNMALWAEQSFSKAMI